jgi:hypothetical protein
MQPEYSHRLPPSPVLELDPERDSHVISSASHQRAQNQVVDVRICLLAILLSTCRLNDIRKEMLHYFPDLFFVVFIYLP